MLYIPVSREHYVYATLEVEEDCQDGVRVLAWVNYVDGKKRYYIVEKDRGQWRYVTLDLEPDDLSVDWDLTTIDARERDNYINSVYEFYETEKNEF